MQFLPLTGSVEIISGPTDTPTKPWLVSTKGVETLTWTACVISPTSSVRSTRAASPVAREITGDLEIRNPACSTVNW